MGSGSGAGGGGSGGGGASALKETSETPRYCAGAPCSVGPSAVAEAMATERSSKEERDRAIVLLLRLARRLEPVDHVARELIEDPREGRRSLLHQEERRAPERCFEERLVAGDDGVEDDAAGEL